MKLIYSNRTKKRIKALFKCAAENIKKVITAQQRSLRFGPQMLLDASLSGGRHYGFVKLLHYETLLSDS